jgi:hypothetical protein
MKMCGWPQMDLCPVAEQVTPRPGITLAGLR